MITNHIAEVYPNVEYTGLQINVNAKSAGHCDKNNMGPSLVIGLGPYCGGQLWQWDPSRDEFDIMEPHKWCLTDGRWPHGVHDIGV